MSTNQLNILTPDYQAYRGNVLKSVAELYRTVDAYPDARVKPFNVSWTTDSSMKKLCSDITKDPMVVVGNVFGGSVTCTDLPAGLSEVKLKVEVMKGLSQKLLKLTAVSVDVSPYIWERTYYLGNLSDWTSLVPAYDPSEVSDNLYYKDFYLGVSDSFVNIVGADYYHESVAKGVFISFDTVDGYIWAIMPEEYTPTVSMNLIKVAMEYHSTVLINSKRYKIWKSVDTHAGTFNLSLS